MTNPPTRGFPPAYTLPTERATPYIADIETAAAAHDVDAAILAQVLHQESSFRADIITGETVSSAGAQGIAQFLPATAAEYGVDPLDPRSAIDGAARYLRWLLEYTKRPGGEEDYGRALAGYNWGVGNIKRKGLFNAPSETRKYVADIIADARAGRPDSDFTTPDTLGKLRIALDA